MVVFICNGQWKIFRLCCCARWLWERPLDDVPELAPVCWLGLWFAVDGHKPVLYTRFEASPADVRQIVTQEAIYPHFLLHQQQTTLKQLRLMRLLELDKRHETETRPLHV